MLRKLTLTAMAALAIGAGAASAETEVEIHNFDFPFEGPFGSYDTMQLQRGLKIYTEICAGCHGLQYVPIRTLADLHGLRIRAPTELLPVLERYVTAMRGAGILVTAGTEHNTLDLIPIEPACNTNFSASSSKR